MEKIKFYLPVLVFYMLYILFIFVQSEAMNYIVLDLGISTISVNTLNRIILLLISIPFLLWIYRNSLTLVEKQTKIIYVIVSIISIYLIYFWWIIRFQWK